MLMFGNTGSRFVGLQRCSFHGRGLGQHQQSQPEHERERPPQGRPIWIGFQFGLSFDRYVRMYAMRVKKHL